MVADNINRVLILLVLVIVLAGYLAKDYVFRIGAAYVLIGIFSIVAYLAFAYGYTDLLLPLLIVFVPLWFMVNEDFSQWSVISAGAIVVFLAYILWRKYS